METRNWSIRSKIVALVAAPLAALVALWVFATVLTAGPALNLLSIQSLFDTVRRPGEVLVAELQRERKLSAVYLADPDGDGADLGTQRAATDQAVASFRRAAGGEGARDAVGAELVARIDAVFTSLDALPGARGYIDRREVDIADAHSLYSVCVESAFRMFYSAATVNEPAIDRNIRALTTMGRARETLSQADAVLAGVFAKSRMSIDDHIRLVQIIGTAGYLRGEGVADLPAADRTAYNELTRQSVFGRLDELQNTVVSAHAPGRAPVRQSDWDPVYATVTEQVRAFEHTATDALDDRATPVAAGILARLAAAALLGLLAVVICVFVSMRVGRSLIGRLTGLRAAALDLADTRLPDVVARLRRGETVDVAAEAPPLEYGADEIGQVGTAFTEVQRTAVQSAVDEAALRRGLNEVFLNIARRSQALLHRQLAVLDTMERRTTDPAELEDLFRIDHLATRMRRHAEDLVILAGAKPGRGWRNPVPVVDVVRGAISEVEDYKRLDITAVQDAHVVGRAVGDVIHLLAELLENAASFSPPHTRVHIAGQSVPHGYAIEIEDRGLGMSPSALDVANSALLEPPAFDPAESARLGLFVVAKLGARHGVRVQLRSSPYGGVTAVVLLPVALMSGGPQRAALPAAPTSPAASAATGRPVVTPAGPGPASPAGIAGQRPAGDESVPGEDFTAAGRRAEPAPVNVDGLAQRRRESPATAHGAAADAPADERADAENDGLPRRRRVEVSGPAGTDATPDGPVAAPRSPHDIRALMTGLQAGTLRGRRDATGELPDPAVAAGQVPGAHTGASAPAGGAVVAPAPADGSARAPAPADGSARASAPADGSAPASAQAGEDAPEVRESDTSDADWSDWAPPGWVQAGWAEAVTALYPTAAAADPGGRTIVHIGEILPPEARSPAPRSGGADTERDV